MSWFKVQHDKNMAAVYKLQPYNKKAAGKPTALIFSEIIPLGLFLYTTFCNAVND